MAGLIIGQFTSGLAAQVAVAFWLRHRDEQPLSPLFYLVIPAIGALVDLCLLTRGFRRPPPEMRHLESAEG